MNDTTPRIRHNSSRTRKRYRGFPQCLVKYKDHFSFLRDSKFLEALENDSVDSDIIDEELSALQQVPISKRERVVKFLQSNPVQILLCAIVLLDAGIVIAQILLDLNSVKEKLHRRDIQLAELIAYIQDVHFDKLYGYSGTNVDHILRLLRQSRENSTSAAALSSSEDSPPIGTVSSLTGSPDDPSLPAVVGNDRPQSRNEVLSWHRLGNMSNALVLSDFDIDDRGGHHGNAAGSHDALHDVAHWLHFASISLLGFLVVEDLVKMLAMGWSFCRHKIEIFDAIIISSSFTIDLVFLNGVSGEEGQKAAAILVVLLLWRIARVVDGIVVTVKQRQEFRIRLQKRARRLAERKVEGYEEERHTRSKQIEALKDLCSKAGITDADIAACAPRQHGHVTTTLDALSSVAKLSVSMTMLMSSGVYNKPLQSTTDGSVSFIEDAFEIKSDSHSLSTNTPRYPPLRIESLPNIQHSSGTSTPANVRRKAFSSKMRRKRTAATGPDCEKTRRLSIQDSIASSTSIAASTDPPTTTTMPLSTPNGSPINNCGIRIVIDKSFDVEREVDSTTPIFPSSGLTFGEMDDREVTSSNSQMFLLSDMI